MPDSVKNKLAKKSDLNSNERYSGEDWGLTGPNCVSNTLGTLKEGLEEIMNSGDYSKKLRAEAKKVYGVIDGIDSFTVSPSGVKSELESAAENNDFVGAQ